MARSKPPQAFTSFRVLGKKAQDLLHRASEELQRRQKKSSTSEPLSAKPVSADADDASLTVRFSPASVAQATFVIVAIAVGLALLVWLKDVIILLGLGFFIAAVIDPGVRLMERWGVPRGIGILVHYVFAVLVFLFLVISLIPIVATQIQQIAFLLNDEVNRFLADPQLSLPLVPADVNADLSKLIEATLQDLSIEKFADALRTFGENASSVGVGSVVFFTRLAGSVAGFFAQLIVVLVLAFFIQMERENVRQWVRGFLTSGSRMYLDDKTEAVHHKIGQWARGQLVLGFCIGLLVYIALLILGMEEYAATLAVLAGFTEFIPYIGPFIAAVPAVLIGLTEGGFLWALIIAGVYYVIQWCENNLLVPLVMRRAVGLSPIAIICAMIAGLSFPEILHPVLGLLLAVPVTTIVTIFLEDWRSQRVRG